ncbi:MAG: O-succinylbenzoic acid--CoA ligase [Saprospiraceae bacterium]|jgi:O-succinylbenzoic acid--CoA ligase
MKFVIYNKHYTKDELLEKEDEFLGDRWILDIICTIREWESSDTDVIVRTSGSTGAPKLISLSKKSMRASALKTIDYFELEKGMNFHLSMPAAYIAGKMMVVRAIVGGMNLLCVPPSSTPFRDLTSTVDFAALTPFQVQSTINDTKSNFFLIKKLIIGGAPVLPYLRKQLEGLRTLCYMTYGMTETITHIAVQGLNGIDASDYFEVIKGVNISEEDDNLIIEADYLSNFKIVTNDKVEIVDSNRFKWIGRSDFVINSGGIKLHPETIEGKLSDFINDPYVILSQVHETLGQCAILLIAGSRYSDQVLERLNSNMKIALDRYEIPKKTYFVKELKTTSTGKVKRDVKLYDLD